MANKLRLNIYPLAKQDLEEIFRYVSVDLNNPTAACALIETFEAAFQRVCLFPESCPFVSNEYVNDSSVRKLVVNNYLAFYRVVESEIQLLRVLYCKRDIQDIM